MTQEYLKWFRKSCQGEADEVVDLLERKQSDYGPAALLVPNAEVGITVRLTDKLERLKSLIAQGVAPQEEPIVDTWQDIVGYGILGLLVHEGTLARLNEMYNSPDATPSDTPQKPDLEFEAVDEIDEDTLGALRAALSDLGLPKDPPQGWTGFIPRNFYWTEHLQKVADALAVPPKLDFYMDFREHAPSKFKPKMVYLCGPIDAAQPPHLEWRKNAGDIFTEAGISCYDPHKAYHFAKGSNVEQEIYDINMEALDACSVVYAFMPKDTNTLGTAFEIYDAVRLGKKVVLVSEQDWVYTKILGIQQFHSSFEAIQHVIEYLTA